MKFYQQSLIFFGIALPALFAIAVVGLCYFGSQKITTALDEKTDNFASSEQTRRAVADIEPEVARERENLERWQSLLSEEVTSSVPSNMRAIAERLPDREFQQTSFERPTGTSGFGSASEQKSSQVRIGIRGTYRSVQRAFLELETRMPQLQLEELRLTPNTSQPSMLNVQVSYTAWED